MFDCRLSSDTGVGIGIDTKTLSVFAVAVVCGTGAMDLSEESDDDEVRGAGAGGAVDVDKERDALDLIVPTTPAGADWLVADGCDGDRLRSAFASWLAVNLRMLIGTPLIEQQHLYYIEKRNAV